MKKILLPLLMLTLFSCRILDKNQMVQEKKQIVIVGAGISGLSAANYLKKNGYEPIIIEAQSKVGGRLKTDRSLGVTFDKGASWIHGPIKNPITKLAKKSGAKTFLTDDLSVKIYDIDGSEYPAETIRREEQKYNMVLDELKGDENKSFGETFYQEHPLYKNQRLWTYMLSAYLEFDTGGDIYNLSSKYFYDDEVFDGEDIIITNGYDNIADYLAKDIDIRLNTKVLGINYSKDKITLMTDKGFLSSDIVLVTVPLGVLKKNVIKFVPTLPKKIQHILDNLEMGVVNKFLLIWDTAFWEKDLQYIGYTPVEKGKFNYFLNLRKFVEANALMTFTFGDYSKETEQMSDDEIVEEIMSHLRNIYGNNLPNPKYFLRTKWSENPFSYGAYSFATKGLKNNAFKAFEKSINNKVFFAGEHTSINYRGTVHGAYLSGIREAKKIMAVD